LGEDAVVRVAVDAKGRMRPDALRAAIGRDAREHDPLMIVATLGTTALGALDDLAELAAIASKRSLHLHVDAAYGGLLALLDPPHAAVQSLELADTVAFDAHKCLDVPLSCGLLLVREPASLELAFSVPAPYLPRDRRGEPWASSLPWSRGFRSLPLLFAVAERGFRGIARDLASRLALGERLRAGLSSAGACVVNETPLPVVVLRPTTEPVRRATELVAIADAVAREVGGFVSLVRMPDGSRALRASVTSGETRACDVDALVAAIASALGACAPHRPTPP
jgi:glutamate/tyrosine decarboxylase-like PLP-dependent enzyme